MPQGAGVVVGEATPIQAVVPEIIPLFARNLACFAADAERGVGEKCSDAAHAVSLILACNSSSAALPRARRPGRMKHVKAFVSMMRTLGSSFMASSSFAESPVAIPREPQ